jgi:hypothetical protein
MTSWHGFGNLIQKRDLRFERRNEMQPAHKLNACSCGGHAETTCGGCGAPICRPCSHQEISSKDLKNIIITTYCPKCKEDPKINTWGTLYWEKLVSLYT